MRICRKILLIFFLTAILVFLFSSKAYAEEQEPVDSDYLEEQMAEMNVDSLWDRLPDDTAEKLKDLGVTNLSPDAIANISTGDVLTDILEQFSGGIPEILNSFLMILAVILICAVLNSMQLAQGETTGNVLHLIGMLCIATSVLPAVLRCIEQAATVIQGGAYFMLGCLPILIALLIASGKAASGASLGTLLLSLCNGIAFLSSTCIIPVLNIFLSFSLVSTLSPGLNLNGICKSIYTGIKWVLGLGMTIFTAFLTMQGLLGNSIQVTTNKTVKYVVSSFVPVVGTALGEAFGTVHNCAKLIRSGVGAFGILAILLLFLPVLLRCVLWNFSLSMSSGIADVFSLGEIGGLLRAISKVMSLLTAILLCSVVMMIVVLEVLIAIGGSV